MVLDTEVFREVVAAIGIETTLSVITMFQEQSQILIQGANNEDMSTIDRTESLHALKGMARQLGLEDLGMACLSAHNAIKEESGESAVTASLDHLKTALAVALDALQHEKKQLLV